MTQEEFETATPEEWAAEVERCKDHVYFYNTYWKLPNGEPVKPITRERWDLIEAQAKYLRFNKGRTARRNYLSTPNECLKSIAVTNVFKAKK